MKQFLSFTRKEFYHIFRDRRTVLILIVMPIVQIILFGFALSTEVKNSRVAILDPTHDMMTQRIAQSIDASEYFSLVCYISTPSQIDSLMRKGEIEMAIVFDNNFAKNRQLQIIADASDPNTATLATNYATAIVKDAISNTALPLTVSSSFLYNPSMVSSYNFVPGVMGMILMLVCAMMTSISIVREKEMGTMEVLLVSPVHPIKIILSKLVPYLVLATIDLAIILIVSRYVLQVPIAGGLGWLLAFSLLFIIVVLSLGLLISTLVKTQVAAMLISGMVLMMPTVILSGMMFPIDNMPLPLQYFSAMMPATWFIQGVRKLMVQGVEIQYVIHEVIILFSMAVVLLSVALKKFKVRL